MKPIVILIGRQPEGCAYELSPDARARLKQVPGAKPARRVVIGYDTMTDFEADRGSIEWNVAFMLTGLNREQLQDLGGVALYDPRARTTTPLRAAA